MNLVILKGNLTRDPEVKYLPSGSSVTEFGIAVNEKWKDRDTGEMREEVYFAECVMWGARGEAFGKFHRKGSAALVRGKLKNDSWDDKATGKKMSKTRIQVEEFEFIGGPAQRDNDGSSSEGRYQRPPQQQQQRRDPSPARPRQQQPIHDDSGPIQDGSDDEIPF